MMAGRGTHLAGGNRATHRVALSLPRAIAGRALSSLRRRFAKAGMLAVCLMVGACVPETPVPTVTYPASTSVDRSLEDFAIVAASAEIVAEFCGSSGIRRNFTNTDALARSYVMGALDQGHSLEELEAALARVSMTEAAKKAIRRLEAQGVRTGDIGSLCRYGKSEIAKGSAVGKLLRLAE